MLVALHVNTIRARGHVRNPLLSVGYGVDSEYYTGGDSVKPKTDISA
jgi:hypothetical protein